MILHVAFKVGRDTAYLDDLYGSNVLLLAARCGVERINRANPFLSFVIGSFYFLYNKFLVRKYIQNADRIFSLVRRNICNEWFIRFLIKRHNIDTIYVHWVGHGFLPSNSIKNLQRIDGIDVIVVNHDWMHFTAGCHVPSKCEKWLLSCSICPQAKRFLPNNLSAKLDNMAMVSDWQFGFVKKTFALKSILLLPNRTFADICYPPPEAPVAFSFENRSVVLLVGVNSSNGDNKGLSFLKLLLKSRVRKNIILITINCEISLEADFSFPKLDRVEVGSIMKMVDIVVVPSHLETFSMVSYEALQNGAKLLVRKGLPPEIWANPSIHVSEGTDDISLLVSLEGLVYGC